MSVRKYLVGIALIVSSCLLFWGYQDGGRGLAAVAGPDRELKLAALTFDDGPHPVYTEQLLDGLRERDVKATFFLIGKSAGRCPELVKRMYEEGHVIGNHTMNHVQLNKQSYEQALQEILEGNQVICGLTGNMPEYIRPPFGEWSEKLSEQVDMTAVLWDVDPRDWKVQNVETVVRRVTQDVEDGDIILLHDVYEESVEAAFAIIDCMIKEGFTFVTVEEIMLD